MEHTYQYAWVIPLLPLPVIMSMGFGLFFIPTATKNLRRIWAFPSVLLLSIAMVFSVQLSIQQINGSSIYQYLWSWTVPLFLVHSSLTLPLLECYLIQEHRILLFQTSLQLEISYLWLVWQIQ